MPYNESISNFKDLGNLEFGESTHGLESDELIYDLEFNEPTYDSVVVVQENKDVELDYSKEKLYKGIVFKSWEEASDTLKLYFQYEGFKLRKGHVEKTSNGTIRKRTMLCEHSGEYKPKNMQLTKETSTKYIKYLWHVNLSQPQKNNPNGNVYITTLDNSHNHDLSPYRTKFFNDSELTQEMYDRVEFYVNTVKLKLLQIQRGKRKDMLNDAASLYEELVRRKNKDP
ncbi:14691_t:CDS:2 [Racocetra persica]|uniref:14691_t:CDS:1 n=1 Tax=Racocetra persica TaxID=160502 RepID=A0ACA9PP69_9GLOM|nr:14691_t:CDS:2 [Racocetra persica]